MKLVGEELCHRMPRGHRRRLRGGRSERGEPLFDASDAAALTTSLREVASTVCCGCVL